jgi:hypothetical protein
LANLPKRFVDAIETPERDAFYWDDELPRFGLLKNVEMKRNVNSLDRAARQDRIEHGATIMPAVRKPPLAIGAAMSSIR